MQIRLNPSPTLLVVMVAVSLGALYASVLPSHLTGLNHAGDGGDFLTAVLTGGIPHPTGYPTYTLLGTLFQYLPFGTPYLRLAFLSMLSAALAMGLFSLWVTRWLAAGHPQAWLAGLVAGIACGTAPLFFSQAVIVEVYGLQALFVVLVLVWASLLLQTRWEAAERFWLLPLAFAAGAGLGNHLTLVLLAPTCLVALGFAWRRGLAPKWLFSQAGFFILGTLVYLYLPIQARLYPPVNWGNPQTWEGFLWQVSAQPYQNLLFSLPLVQVPERISAWASLLREQYGAAGLLLGVFGAFHFTGSSRYQRWLLVWVIAVYSVFAIGYNTDDSTAYLLPAFLIFAAWIGLALLALIPLRWKGIRWGALLAIGFCAYMLIRVPGSRQQVDPRLDTYPAQMAENILAAAPPDAILLTLASEDTFPLWYYHFGLGLRPDVAVIVMPLTQFTWYQETIIHTYPELIFPPQDAEAIGTTRWGEKIPGLNSERPTCRNNFSLEADESKGLACSPGGIAKD